MPDSYENLIYGRHPVLDALTNHPDRIEKIWIQNGAKYPESLWVLLKDARRRGGIIHRVEKNVLDRITEAGLHQGIALRLSVSPLLDFDPWIDKLDSTESQSVILVLEGIQDPRNLGAIFRTASAAGVTGILFPKHSMAPLSPAAMKASAGTLHHVPAVRVSNIHRTLQILKDRGYWIVGLSEKAELAIWDHALPERLVFLAGGESGGIRKINAKICDELRRIPLTGPAGSLNVSVAISIALYESVRMKHMNSRQSQNFP